MSTPIYIKLDAPEQLLLGEGVCRQLQMVTYHPSVCIERKENGEKTQRQTTRKAERGRRPANVMSPEMAELSKTSNQYKTTNNSSGVTLTSSRPGGKKPNEANTTGPREEAAVR